MRAVPRLVSLALIASGLAACQSTMAPQSAVPGGAVPASLPPAAAEPGESNLRAQVAARVVKDYMTDSAGPAEVTPVSAGTFIVRFPVREEKVRGLPQVGLTSLVSPNEPNRRCITASIGQGLLSETKSVVLRTLATDHRTTCGDGPWQPYPELERMVDTIRACLARRQDTCELSVEAASKAAEARVAETKPTRGQR